MSFEPVRHIYIYTQGVNSLYSGAFSVNLYVFSRVVIVSVEEEEHLKETRALVTGTGSASIYQPALNIYTSSTCPYRVDG